MSANKTLVIDNGSRETRAGFAGEDSPRLVFPSVVGFLNSQKQNPQGLKDTAIGLEAMDNKDSYSLHFPVRNGVITNFDYINCIWSHIFDSLCGGHPEEYQVLLTENPSNSKEKREETTQWLFEKFGIQGLFLANRAPLSVISTGSSTGVNVDIGHDMGRIVPVYESYVLPEAMINIPMGGKHVTDCLINSLNKKGQSFKTEAERETIRDIKEKLCYISLDKETEKASGADYKLPDGRSMTLTNERFECPEGLFEPSVLDVECQGLHELVFSSIKKCDIDLRKDMYANIIVSGGASLFPGIADRLKKEIARLAPSGMTIKVAALPGRQSSAWIGGAMVASMPSYQNMWLTKAEYYESGPSAIHTKSLS